MKLVDKYLADKLQERAHANNLRRLTTKRAPVDFFSNDYLGWVANGVIQKALVDYPAELLATGSTGSRLLSGNNDIIVALEDVIAAFHHAEAALVFNSGYDANVGLLSCIASRHTTYIYDELCHASTIDGIRLSAAVQRYKFRHNDLKDLEDKLIRVKGPIIVVVDSVYSMDGDLAPLEEIVALTKQYGVSLVVDEAHATGIFGERGEGLVCGLGLQDDVFARVHTFGKALGCHGAAVVGSRLLRQYLINFARSFIYTTALPPHTISSIDCAYKHLSAPDFSNKALHDLIAYFRNKAKECHFDGWINSLSPIQVLVTGDNHKTKTIAEKLQAAGLQINPILHPAVPLGMERLRICLHAFNTEEQVDHLMEVLNTNL